MCDRFLSTIQKVLVITLFINKLHRMKFEFLSELDWRQLFDIYEDIQGALSSMGLKIYPVDFEKHLKGLIKNCRNYFSSSATDEMLAEFRPFFCPHDSIMIKAISYCSLFLPTTSVER